MDLSHYLILSMLLFVTGAVGFIVKKNIIAMFLCVELMLNAVNLSFIAFSKFLNLVDGQIVVFFVMVIGILVWLAAVALNTVVITDS